MPFCVCVCVCVSAGDGWSAWGEEGAGGSHGANGNRAGICTSCVGLLFSFSLTFTLLCRYVGGVKCADSPVAPGRGLLCRPFEWHILRAFEMAA